MSKGTTTIDEWCRIVEAEYREMPGLSLTRSQIQRLWGLDTFTTDAVLRRLVSAGFFRETDGEYVLGSTALANA